MNWQTLKNIRRLNKIIITLIRYGFGGIVSEMRVFPLLSTIERIFVSKKKTEGLSVAVRLRLLFEELGPTFIKLGQIASTRADIFPQEWIDEFKKLQDMVPPTPFEEIRKEVEASLHGPLEVKFASFNPEPEASASIAQVHCAELTDGTKVAVKVKRPGIDAIIGSDLSVMRTMATLFVKYVPRSRRFRPVEVVDEFSRVIKNEEDLSVEGVHINRFYAFFEDDPTVQIPKVYWDYTTEEVLTMERVEGYPIDEAEKIRAKGLDVQAIAVHGVELFFKQVFEFGTFHADLHPGNILVRDDGVLIYLDFGIVGWLDKKTRKYLANLLYYWVKADYHRMALVHREMGLIGDETDIHEFEEALRDISEPIFGRTLEQIHMSTLFMKLLQIARQFDIELQPNLLLLQKSMVIMEGVGRQLYPDVNMWEVAKPLIYKWMIKEKFSPKAALDKGLLYGEDLLEAALELPSNANDLVKKALADKLSVNYVHRNLEPLAEEVRSAGSRIGAGVVTGSIIIGSSIFAASAEPGDLTILGLPVVSFVGFLLAILLVLMYGKTGRRKKKK